MHILLLPSWYPTPADPVNAVFFMGRVDPTANHHDRSGIARHVGLRVFGATIAKKYGGAPTSPSAS
ncbi:MAG: hypothetical protein WCH77_03690 [Planctomycetota bacterium]